VNQPAFESSVRSLVAIGMPVSAATESLRAFGLSCSAGNPIDCSRVRQRLWPSSCIERVKLTASDRHTVENMDIRPIVCAGL